MSVGRPDVVENGVTITGETQDITDWMQECFEKLEGGHEQDILSDPFYTPRTGALDAERVDQLIAELDREFALEIDQFPDYHDRRSGANAKPEWSRMGPTARRAMAEGFCRILEAWDDYRAGQKS